MLSLRLLFILSLSLFSFITPVWSIVPKYFQLFGNLTIQGGGTFQSPTLLPTIKRDFYRRPDIGFSLDAGLHHKGKLRYISLQCKDFYIHPSYLERSGFQFFSLGAGYRTVLDSATLIGGYLFLDGISEDKATTFNLNIGLETAFSVWHGHANCYIPILYPYSKALKPPAPKVVQLDNNILTQHYLLEKGNFGCDITLTRERLFLNHITPSISIYYFYDRYSKQNIWGGVLNVEHSLNERWHFYYQLGGDKIRNYMFNVGLQWKALGGYNPQGKYFYQRICLPHKRHLSPIFLIAENKRLLITLEDKTYWNRCIKAEEKDNWKMMIRHTYSGLEVNTRKQIFEAVDFFFDYSPEAAFPKNPKELKRMYHSLSLKYHPDKASSNQREEYTGIFQELNNHRNTLERLFKHSIRYN
jgi:hypothetical protein